MARSAYRPDDIGFTGAIQDTTCPEFSRVARLQEMAEQVQGQSKTQTAAALRGVSRSYLELTKRASDPDVALENYITFALLSSDKTGAAES